MKKIALNVLIISLYSFPFVYFSMNQDFETGSIIGYVMMIIFTSTVAFFGKLTKNTLAIFIGNISSAIISFYFITQIASNHSWDEFFKPLTPFQLFILISFLNMIPQLISMKLAAILRIKLNYIWIDETRMR